MGYLNPLLGLPAARRLLALSAHERSAVAAVLMDLRLEANALAESSWRRKKGPMAAYYRAVSTYARHLAHILRLGGQVLVASRADAELERMRMELEAARTQVTLLVSASRAALPAECHPLVDDATHWARQLRGARLTPRARPESAEAL
jgi:hypothetical protein